MRQVVGPAMEIADDAGEDPHGREGHQTPGKPGQDGRGDVLSKSIEQSNVDIANEFVNLMGAQRNFQANTRTITTADQMLQEVLNIKR